MYSEVQIRVDTKKAMALDFRNERGPVSYQPEIENPVRVYIDIFCCLNLT
jgi:hypothetical protein